MDLQSVLISFQFTLGIWVGIHDAEYTVLDDQNQAQINIKGK